MNESLNHILQNCHYTHFQRIRRHNSIVDFIKKKCVTNNYLVLEEPIFDVGDKKLKPDLVIIKPTEIIIIDVSIVTANMRFQHMQEPGTLNNIWEYKARYYNNEQLNASLTERFGPAEIWNGSVIIS